MICPRTCANMYGTYSKDIFLVNMGKFYIYSLKLKQNVFGLIFSHYPLLHQPSTEEDQETWGQFFIEFLEENELSFVQTKRLSEITNELGEAVRIKFPKDFLLIPCYKRATDNEFAKSEIGFIKEFLNILYSADIDFKEIYKYPSKPNMHIQEVFSTSYQLKMLTETIDPKFTPEIKKQLLDVTSRFYPTCLIHMKENTSIFPVFYDNDLFESFSPAIGILQFCSYFRSFLSALDHIIQLFSKLRLDVSFFPYLLQSFSLEFIPSFVRNHNFTERIGDAVLDVVVTHSMVSALISKQNYFLNKQIKIAVSNKLFGIIGEQLDFTSCFIGPYDIEKLPGDCFEAIAGSLFNVYSYEKVCDFWREMLFIIPQEKAQELDVLKAVEAMKVGIKSDSIEVIPDNDSPDNILNLIGKLVPPPKDDDGKLQIKCKLIGTAFIKLSIVLTVIRKLKLASDTSLIPHHSSKESLNKVAEKLGLKNSKFLRVLVGGLMLTNGFEPTMRFMQTKVIPLFEITKEVETFTLEKSKRK